MVVVHFLGLIPASPTPFVVPGGQPRRGRVRVAGWGWRAGHGAGLCLLPQPRGSRGGEGRGKAPPSRGHRPCAHAGPGPTCADVLMHSQPRHPAEGRTKAQRAPAMCPQSCVVGHRCKAGWTAGSQSPGLLGLQVWASRQQARTGTNMIPRGAGQERCRGHRLLVGAS